MAGIHNIGNVYSSNSKKISSKLSFDVGEKFKGKIIKAGEGNEVVVKLLDGWQFSAEIDGDFTALLDVLQKFEVEGFEKGKLKLKLITEENTGEDVAQKNFNEIIAKGSLSKNDKFLLESMLKFNIPLTKENIKEIKGIIQFLDKINNNPEEIDKFIQNYLLGKGIAEGSEKGKNVSNLLRNFFQQFKNLSKEDILLFFENNIELSNENIQAYNNIFKGNSKVPGLLSSFSVLINNGQDHNGNIALSNNQDVSIESKITNAAYNNGNALKAKVSALFLLSKMEAGEGSEVIEKLLNSWQTSEEISSGDITNLIDAFQKFELEGFEDGGEINGIIRFLDKMNNNSQEVDKYIQNYLISKGISEESENGKNTSNLLRNIFQQLENLSEEDILLFFEKNIEFKNENIQGEVLPKEIDLAKSQDASIEGKIANEAYHKNDTSSAKVSMLSLLKSLSGQSEEIINTALKDIIINKRLSFTSNEFERVFNAVSKLDPEKFINNLINTITEFEEVGSGKVADDFSNYINKRSNEDSGIKSFLNFTKTELEFALSRELGTRIELVEEEFSKLKDAINLKYQSIIEGNLADKGNQEGNNGDTASSLKENYLKENVNKEDFITDEVLVKDNLNKENIINDGTNKEVVNKDTLNKEVLKGNLTSKEQVEASINKTGEENKNILKETLSIIKNEGQLTDKVIDIIKNNINEIKLFNKFSEEYYYGEFPVNIREAEYPCKIIVKDNRKEGKKIDSKNVKMVITIDTKNLGTIDGYVVVRDKKLDIDLKCEEDSAKILNMSKIILEKNIENMGFNVNIKVIKKEEEVSLATCRDFFNTGVSLRVDRRI